MVNFLFHPHLAHLGADALFWLLNARSRAEFDRLRRGHGAGAAAPGEP
jgi:hypothetical protein